MEHERKFLINEFPEHLKRIEKAEVMQSYISTSPELRIRKILPDTGGEQYMMTVKLKGVASRPEVNVEITKEQYEELAENIPARPIQKDYRAYEMEDGRKLEVSLVDPGSVTEFMYAEIEFDTAEEMMAYEPAALLGREVTEDPEYKMKKYWKNRL